RRGIDDALGLAQRGAGTDVDDAAIAAGAQRWQNRLSQEDAGLEVQRDDIVEIGEAGGIDRPRTRGSGIVDQSRDGILLRDAARLCLGLLRVRQIGLKKGQLGMLPVWT